MGCTQREAAIKFRRLPFQIDAIFNKYRERKYNLVEVNYILRNIEDEVIKLFGNDVVNAINEVSS
jgi:hypothetical protein